MRFLRTKENVAINGYDAVSYFSNYAAERGSKAHSADYKGSTFYFTSAAHKKEFLTNPQKYVPAYGGYCAFAMGMKNAKVPSNPTTFKVYNGKLYLFFNDYYEGTPFNTIVPWNSDETNMVKKANANWAKM